MGIYEIEGQFLISDLLKAVKGLDRDTPIVIQHIAYPNTYQVVGIIADNEEVHLTVREV